MTLHSSYGDKGFMYGSVGCASAAFFFFWLCVVVLVAAKPSKKMKYAAVSMHVLACLFCLLLLATVQSFQLLPFWATVLISIVPAVISGLLLTILTSSNFFVLFRREESSQSTDTTELLPYWEHTALNRLSKLNMGRCTCITTTLSESKMRFTLITFALLVCSMLLTAGTYGGCGCEHPVVFTTSFSRLFSPGVCLPDRMCHIYAQPGAASSSIALIFHYVVGWQTSIVPVAAFGTVCNAAADCLVSTTRQGRLIDNSDIFEDRRFIGHVLFSNLDADVLYTFAGIFVMSDGSNRTIRQLFRTLPDSGNISVVAGGDYESSGLGHKLLLLGFGASNSDARMIYIGGDIAYENNMRYCYRRLDSVIDDLTELRRNDGSQPLLLTAVGNHEAGGWLLATTEEERRSFFAFYPKYFPSISADAYSNDVSYRDESTFYVDGRITSTFHAHKIGGAFWIILDSNTINDVKTQVSFLTSNLENWKQQISTNTTTATKIVVSYHAPAFPSVTPITDKRTTALRKSIIPVLDSYVPYVTWVMEHHDHTYKRTKPVQNFVPTKGGIVYSGDGSLGVHEDVDAPRQEDYLDVTIPGNYVFHLIMTDDPLQTVEAFAIGEAGTVLDHFVV